MLTQQCAQQHCWCSSNIWSLVCCCWWLNISWCCRRTRTVWKRQKPTRIGRDFSKMLIKPDFTLLVFAWIFSACLLVCLFACLLHWLTDWFIDWLIHWLTDRLVPYLWFQTVCRRGHRRTFNCNRPRTKDRSQFGNRVLIDSLTIEWRSTIDGCFERETERQDQACTKRIACLYIHLVCLLLQSLLYAAMNGCERKKNSMNQGACS